MSPRRIASTFVLALGGLFVLPTAARAEPVPVRRVVLDRIVAVVDRDVITLVELRRRAAPLLVQLASIEAAKRPVVEAELHRQLVDRLIEERLIAWRARMASITVSASDIDNALDAVAKSNGVTRDELLAEARASGLPEPDYRDELRRQLLSYKVLRMYIARKNAGAAMTDAQMEEARRAMIEEVRREVHIEVRL